MVVVFSNEMMNKSSLAAGLASIEPVSMKALQSQPHVALNLAGIGSAGESNECNSPKAARSPSVKGASPRNSPRSSPRSTMDTGSPLHLTISTPLAVRTANSRSPFFPKDDSPESLRPRNGDSWKNGVEAMPVGRSTPEPTEDQ